MGTVRLKHVWLGIMLGVLIATAPNWLQSDGHKKSAYDAPWIYPADLPGNAQ